MKAKFEIRLDGSLADWFKTKDFTKAYSEYDKVVNLLKIAKATSKVELILVDSQVGNDTLAKVRLTDGVVKERTVN